jgi:hypothetical protein
MIYNKQFIKMYRMPIQYRIRKYTNSWYAVFQSDRKYNNDHKHHQLYGYYQLNKFQPPLW